MFTRTRRVGSRLYTEALQSYRDPETGRPKHLCVARWRAEHSFVEELGRTRYAIENAEKNVAYWQGIIDRTVRPRFWKQYRRAPGAVVDWRRRLEAATAHLAALTEVRAAGMAVDDGEIEQATLAERARWDGMLASLNAAITPRPAPDNRLADLADKARGLMQMNDPDAVRAGLAEIAGALDELGGRKVLALHAVAD
jgi:hypothetical protein